MVECVGDWCWSSYAATAGVVQSPTFLDAAWLLSQFGSSPKAARKAYRRFVANGDKASPWDDLNGPDVLGDDAFRSALQQRKCNANQEVPRRKQVLRCLPFPELAKRGKTRGVWMREAYQEHGYTMQAIADYAGIHHSTVSRLIKGTDENARNKT